MAPAVVPVVSKAPQSSRQNTNRTCLLQPGTASFLAQVSRTIFTAPLPMLKPLFVHPTNILKAKLGSKPDASLLQASEGLIEVLETWVKGASDTIPLALFLSLGFG
jgi:hypothetical protein